MLGASTCVMCTRSVSASSRSSNRKTSCARGEPRVSAGRATSVSKGVSTGKSTGVCTGVSTGVSTGMSTRVLAFSLAWRDTSKVSSSSSSSSLFLIRRTEMLSPGAKDSTTTFVKHSLSAEGNHTIAPGAMPACTRTSDAVAREAGNAMEQSQRDVVGV
eukprot:1371517-Prymnesium_polylepis.1